MAYQTTTFIPPAFVPESLVGVPIKVRRIPSQIDSEISQINPNGNLATFTLPSSSVLDFTRGNLRFTASASRVGGSFVRFQNNISGLISRIVINCGSKTVCDLQNYNLWDNIPKQTAAIPGAISSVFFVMSGMGSAAQRNTWSSGKQYEIALAVDALQHPLPLPLMSEQLRVLIYFAAPGDCMESDSANVSYSITGITLFFDRYEFPSGVDYVGGLRQQLIQRGKFSWAFTSYDHFNETVATNGRSTVQIPSRRQSIRSYVAIMRDAATISSLSTFDKLETFNYNNMITSQFRLNNVLIPEREIDDQGVAGVNVGGTEPYYYFLEALRDWSGYSNITLEVAVAQNFYTNKFVIAYPFESFRTAMSGEDLETTYSNFTFTFQLSGLAVAQILEQYIVFDRIWTLRADGTSVFDD